MAFAMTSHKSSTVMVPRTNMQLLLKVRKYYIFLEKTYKFVIIQQNYFYK